MRLRIILILTVLVLLTSCNMESSTSQGESSPANQLEESGAPKVATLIVEDDDGRISQELFTTENCLKQQENPIALVIADDYESATYEQVLTWFCAGAEFEDIVLAQETEELTGEPAANILVMLSEGFTWEEIWILLEVTE